MIGLPKGGNDDGKIKFIMSIVNSAKICRVNHSSIVLIDEGDSKSAIIKPLFLNDYKSFAFKKFLNREYEVFKVWYNDVRNNESKFYELIFLDE